MASVVCRQVFIQGAKLTKLSSTILDKHVSKVLAQQICRNIYGPGSLGMTKYIESRNRSAEYLGPMKDKFREKMEEYLNSPDKNMIFTEDLRNMVHLAESNEDLEICKQMMIKFNSQNDGIRFGTYVFGPVIMRMYHYLNKADEAYETFTSKELQSMFTQVSSYFVLLDLLYKSERYQKVLDGFDFLQSNQTFVSRFPRESVNLTLAACYKLNTKESYEYGLKLLKKARTTGAIVLRKGLAFLTKLALDQNDPTTALEILSAVNQPNYITVRNLRLQALTELKRFDDCFTILKVILQNDRLVDQSDVSGQVCKDSINKLLAAVEKGGNQEEIHMLNQYLKALEASNNICSSTLDELLCLPVPDKDFTRKPSWESNRNQNRFQKPYRQFTRSGLADMD